MTHSVRTVASCNVQRSLQKTSGLFNNDLPDVADSVASVAQEDVAMETAHNKQAAEFGDVFTLLDKNQDSLVDLGLEPSLNLDLGDQDFLEGFIDLSELLGTEAMETSPADDEISLPTSSTSALAPPDVITSNRKRKAVESTPASTTSTPIIPYDHIGYTSKRSRISSDISLSDTDSEVGTSSNTLTKAERYVERRRKNNIASRRSRETRKQKFVSMEDKATKLEIANAELRQKVTLLEEMAKEMKETLIKRLASK